MHSVPILWTTDPTPIPDLRVTGWPLSEEGAEAVFTLELPRKGSTTEDPVICEGFPPAPTDTAMTASVLPLFAGVIAPPPQTEAGEMGVPTPITLIGAVLPPPLPAIEAPEGVVMPPPPPPIRDQATRLKSAWLR